MELQIDLLKRSEKSWFKIIWGSAAILAVLLMIVNKTIIHRPTNPSDWIQVPGMLLFACWLLFTGLGHHVRKFFGRAYIRIDDHLIAVKKGIQAKEESILWKEIKSIQYKYNLFWFIREDNSSFLLKLSDYEYRVIKEVRNAIVLNAKEKGISIN